MDKIKIVIDIETIPTEIDQAWLEEKREKIVRSYKTENTIMKHLEEAADSWKWELGGTQIVCVGIKNLNTGETKTLTCSDEKLLLETLYFAVRDWTKRLGDGTHYERKPLQLIGFNIQSFDLPHLHVAYARHGLPAPFKLYKHSVTDLINWPYGHQLGRRSLNYYLRAFGVEGKTGNGADVERLWREDQEKGTNQVVEYCKADVEKTAELYLRMGEIWQD